MVFSFKKAVIKHNSMPLIDEFNWEVNEGESWWIYGANGSGKTTLLNVLAGKQRLAGGEIVLPHDFSFEKFSSSIALIARDFSLNHLFNKSASFYQQRYFSLGVEDTPLVIDFIAAETGISKENIHSTAHEFKFDSLLDKHIISLSTGEGRRILLLILWLTDKKIICFDDPYTGLDPEGEQLVSHALQTLLKKNVTILVTGVKVRPPDFMSHVLYIKDRRIGFAGKAQDFISKTDLPSQVNNADIKRHVGNGDDRLFSVAADMNNITIKYADKIIQKDFSWKICRGDKWMITGPNGSGKSTLMGLIYGDSPMAYAYEMVIFDRVRGTGESIWDIKRRMGYFSSELHHFFPRSMTLYEAVLTGYSDHLALRKDLTSEHHKQAVELIDAAGISDIKDVPMYRLSFSQCRLGLICRALVKFPPVVILDEPCQGLDQSSIATVNRLVDAVCTGEDKTLIYVTHQPGDIPKIINHHLNLGRLG